MPSLTGVLHKMHVRHEIPISYRLEFESGALALNPLVGEKLTIRFTGRIFCEGCGKSIPKSYGGFCYPCTQTLASCDLCILKPELCHYHRGTCREPQWGLEHCFQPHIVYLANSSALKVGITRETQVPIRWIDQGASQALPLFRVTNRKYSGLLEVAFKDWVADKTNWRKMLAETPPVDLCAARDRLLLQLEPALARLETQLAEGSERLNHAQTLSFAYPVVSYPAKIQSLNLDKTPIISAQLLGIKGQYLIFEHGVINIRSHQGYEVVCGGL